jgi:hypothetical protein
LPLHCLLQSTLATSSNNKNKLMLASAYLDKASLNFKEQEYGNKALSLAEEVLKEPPRGIELPRLLFSSPVPNLAST